MWFISIRALLGPGVLEIGENIYFGGGKVTKRIIEKEELD